MTRAEILYLVPYVAFLVLSTGVFYYVWRRRNVAGGVAFALYVGARTLSIFGFIIELISPDLSGKIFWDKIQWYAELVAIVILPVFAVQYTEYKLHNARRLFALSLIVPALFGFAVLTDGLHHLIYPNPQLSNQIPFPELTYDFTLPVYGIAFYGYALIAWVIGTLVRRFFRLHNLPRAQTAVILLGILIPLAGTMLSLIEVNIAPQRDITPFTSSIGNLFIAWGLLRLRLFDIVPIARERIFENMADQVIVLDVQNRIIDINPAALRALGGRGANVIGKSINLVFPDWAGLVEQAKGIEQINTEVKSAVDGETAYYSLNISIIHNREKQIAGRVMVAHDITKRKTLEDGYRTLSQELEQRVRERTDELRKSVEQYRAVVENQTEFIVRWKPDGTHTFVNDAYCRYFHLTREQAMFTNFLEWVLEEDRQIVKEKISRLGAGSANVETSIHRVLKPDGGIGWQEWTAHVIQYTSGQVVEIQSVGRDVTARKQMEDDLKEGEERFSTLSAATFEAIALTEQGTIIDVNEQMLAMFGYTRIEVIGMNVSQLVAPESSELVRRRISARSEEPYEHIALKKDGRRFHVEVRPRAMPYRGRPIRVTAIRDITERKTAEENLTDAYQTTLEGWAKALELRDEETEGHSRRVTEMTLTLARAMGFTEEQLVDIHRGSILHDIGKMGVPDQILRKNGPLNEEERKIVQQHPDTAFNLLKEIAFLEKSLEIPYCHHEKWDGTGYPRGLKQEEIPIAARIFAVADVWDALSSDRPYREAWSKEKAVNYIKEESEKYFDPEVVRVFLQLFEKGKI